MLSVMAIHGFRGNIKENNLKNSTLNMLKIQPYIDAIALFLRNKALSYMAPGEERHDNQYPNTYGLCCLHRTVDMADGGYFLHTVILKPLISNTITPMQLLRRMPKWMGTRPMHVATRSVSNPNTLTNISMITVELAFPRLELAVGGLLLSLLRFSREKLDIASPGRK
jgi:hypothetical protein